MRRKPSTPRSARQVRRPLARSSYANDRAGRLPRAGIILYNKTYGGWSTDRQPQGNTGRGTVFGATDPRAQGARTARGHHHLRGASALRGRVRRFDAHADAPHPSAVTSGARYFPRGLWSPRPSSSTKDSMRTRLLGPAGLSMRRPATRSIDLDLAFHSHRPTSPPQPGRRPRIVEDEHS